MTRAAFQHPEATAELVAAAAWFEERETGLGQRFLDAAKDAIDDVLRWPDAAPLAPGWTRQPPVRHQRIAGFRYRIVYVRRADAIVTVAFAHERREPGYWRFRVEA